MQRFKLEEQIQLKIMPSMINSDSPARPSEHLQERAQFESHLPPVKPLFTSATDAVDITFLSTEKALEEIDQLVPLDQDKRFAVALSILTLRARKGTWMAHFGLLIYREGDSILVKRHSAPAHAYMQCIGAKH